MPTPFVTDFVDLFSGVSDSIIAQRIALGLTPLVAPVTSPSGTVGCLLFGSEFNPQEDSPPRIVIVPTGARYAAATVMGRQQQVSGLVPQIEPKTRFTRWLGFEAYLWGDEDPAGLSSVYSFSSALELERELLTAIYDNCGNTPNIQHGEGRWDQPSNLTRLGRLYVLPFWIGTPVTDLPNLVLPFQTDTASGVAVSTSIEAQFFDGSSTLAAVIAAPPPDLP